MLVVVIVDVGVLVPVFVVVLVAVFVDVGVLVAVFIGVGVLVAVSIGVGVLLAVSVGVATFVVGVLLAVGTGVGVFVAVSVGVLVAVLVGGTVCWWAGSSPSACRSRSRWKRRDRGVDDAVVAVEVALGLSGSSYAHRARAVTSEDLTRLLHPAALN